MRQQRSNDLWEAFQQVTDAAERFVNRSPRLKRLEEDRQALLDAIRRAQLVLSVKRLPPFPEQKNLDVTNLADHRKRRQSVSSRTNHKRSSGNER
jgi:hypothetical protein